MARGGGGSEDEAELLYVSHAEGARHESAPDEEGSRGGRRKPGARLNAYTARCVLAVSLFAALLGYDIGVMSGAVLPLARTLHLGLEEQEAVVGSLNFVSGAGALMAGSIYSKVGAVRCVGAAVVMYGIGMGAIAAATEFAHVMVGRIVVGVAVGLGFALCPQYIAEISPQQWRGVLVSCFEISINVGLCLGYLANVCLHSLPDHTSWRLLMLLPLLPTGFVAIALLPTLPESPRWLVAGGQEAAARDVVARTCGEEEVETIIEEITSVIDQDKEARGATWSVLLRGSATRRGLVLGVGTAFFQQANGSEAAVYYVPQVLRDAGVRSELQQLWASLLVGVCKTVFITIGQLRVDRAGRRPTLISSIAGVTVSLALLGTCFAYPGTPVLVTLAALCSFMATFSVGEGPVTWVIASEIMPLAARSKGLALAMAVNRTTSGAVALTFLSLTRLLGAGGTFWLFAVVSLAHLVFTARLLPETRGKSLEEVECLLAN